MTKGRYGSALILAAAMAVLGICQKTALAQAWDPQQTPLTPSGGSGTWDNTTANWSNWTSDVAWKSTYADFEAPGGAVTIGAPITAEGVNLNAGGYTFSSSTPANVFTIHSSSVDSLYQAPGVTGVNEFVGPLNFNEVIVYVDGGTLKFSNTLVSAPNSITGTTFYVATGATLESNVANGVNALGNGGIQLDGGTAQINLSANDLNYRGANTGNSMRPVHASDPRCDLGEQ